MPNSLQFRAQCLDLRRRGGVGDRQTAIGSWHVVIDSAESKIRTSHFSTCLAQAIKRLRRRYLVNEMKIDVKECRLTTRFTNDVRVATVFRITFSCHKDAHKHITKYKEKTKVKIIKQHDTRGACPRSP